ncbi:MAG TPA: hypothetical protein VNU49_02905 [Opitutaceae bacterium]|nr:hypothetical protein [Opitutaceae bacterium]
MTITASALFLMLVLLPEILALALLNLLVRFCFSPVRMSPFLWVCGAQIALSAFLLATNSRTLPGPFISISTDIFPALGSLIMFMVVGRTFWKSPAAERVGLSLVAVASVAIVALVVMDVQPFWAGPFGHARLIGW